MKYFLRKLGLALLPRSMRLTTPLADGTRIIGQNRAGYGGRGIFVFREFIEPEYAHVLTLMKGREVFVDVGASTGIYALKVARYLKQRGIVLAFEPNPEIAADLLRATRLNRLANLRLRVLAVGDEIAPSILWMNDNRPNRFSMIDRGSEGRSIPTLTMPLDHIVSIERLQSLDYLKIDVNGTEAAVLRGACGSIERFRPLIQCKGDHLGELPCLKDYRAFNLRNSRTRLMVHRDDARIETVCRIGFREWGPRLVPEEDRSLTA